MANKHYNAAYLEETAKILEVVKSDSYRFFDVIADGGTIVDLGCGIGNDVMSMASVFAVKNLRLIGVDHDPKMIDAATAALESQDNITFVLSDVTSLPFSENTVDGIRAERLFQHVADSELLFGEINRILKPHGRIVIVETDWKSLSFFNGNVAVANKINDYLTDRKVNNGYASRKISCDLQSNGFRDIDFRVYPFVLTRYDDACNYLWVDRILHEMLDMGLLTSTEHSDFIGAQIAAEKAGFFACHMNIVLATAVKYI